jgi:hypothetical protein
MVVAPDVADWAPRPRVDNAMVKALTGVSVAEDAGHRVHATQEDLAKAKGVAASYVSRVLRLTLLALEIVEAILDGRQPAELQLDDLLGGVPIDWARQSDSLRIIGGTGRSEPKQPRMSCSVRGGKSFELDLASCIPVYAISGRLRCIPRMLRQVAAAKENLVVVRTFTGSAVGSVAR